ncbi:hypothetical protein ACFLTE_09415 [Bacteroidota bacterium]
MKREVKYDNYPTWIVIISNFVSLSIYGLGFMILIQLGWIISILYLIFILFFEFRLISMHCVNCYYRGKTCGFGKGRISSLLFKKGDASRFCEKEMTWKNMIPDLLISLIPFTIGIIVLIIKFDYRILFALIILIVLTTIGNGFVRGTLTCRYCKQKDLGCPADKLFNKEK